MTNEEAKLLLNKYNKGLASSSEAALLQYWYIHEASQGESDINEHELQQIVVEMRKQVLLHTKPSGIRLYPFIAAAVAVISLGVWFYSAHYMNVRPYANDVKPGRNTATLTLADGRIMQLNDAKTGIVVGRELKYSDGSAVERGNPSSRQDPNTVAMLTASTPRGGSYQVTLSDGTKVWLNADSKISFPSQFSGKERRIILEGEAYFVVVHNEKQPFKVVTTNQVVEDIGTEFNINAYTDEGSTKTTLIEGSAKVSPSPLLAGTKQPSNDVVLKPNQQSILQGEVLQITQGNAEEAIAWKNNKFVFANANIQSIMREISRWYNVDVVYEESVTSQLFVGEISRFENVSKVLNMLEFTGAVHFKIEGRRIIVKK